MRRCAMPDNAPSVIYAISSGSYSDYSVHAVFATHEDAERFNTENDLHFSIEEMPYYAEGEQPEGVVWYQGHMSVNDIDPDITERSDWPWEWGAENYAIDRPKVNFSGYAREAPSFFGHCKDRELLERALREKTQKYRAELDQLCRDVAGALHRLAGNPPRPVKIHEIAAIVGRDDSVVAWAVDELHKMGVVEDVKEPKREIRREEMEPPEPGQYRIPILGPRTKPPRPSDD